MSEGSDEELVGDVDQFDIDVDFEETQTHKAKTDGTSLKKEQIQVKNDGVKDGKHPVKNTSTKLQPVKKKPVSTKPKPSEDDLLLAFAAGVPSVKKGSLGCNVKKNQEPVGFKSNKGSTQQGDKIKNLNHPAETNVAEKVKVEETGRKALSEKFVKTSNSLKVESKVNITKEVEAQSLRETREKTPSEKFDKNSKPTKIESSANVTQGVKGQSLRETEEKAPCHQFEKKSKSVESKINIIKEIKEELRETDKNVGNKKLDKNLNPMKVESKAAVVTKEVKAESLRETVKKTSEKFDKTSHPVKVESKINVKKELEADTENRERNETGQDKVKVELPQKETESAITQKMAKLSNELKSTKLNVTTQKVESNIKQECVDEKQSLERSSLVAVKSSKSTANKTDISSSPSLKRKVDDPIISASSPKIKKTDPTMKPVEENKDTKITIDAGNEFTDDDYKMMDNFLADEMLDSALKKMRASARSEVKYTVHVSPLEISDLAQPSLLQIIELHPTVTLIFKRQAVKFKKKKGFAEGTFTTMTELKEFVYQLTQLEISEKKLDVQINAVRTYQAPDKLSFVINLNSNAKLLKLIDSGEDPKINNPIPFGKNSHNVQFDRVPSSANGAFMHSMFPFANNVHIKREVVGKEVSPTYLGPLSVCFINAKWRDAVMECCSDFVVNDFPLSRSGNPASELKPSQKVVASEQQGKEEMHGRNESCSSNADVQYDDLVSSMTHDVCADVLDSIAKLQALDSDNPNMQRISEMQKRLSELKESLIRPRNLSVNNTNTESDDGPSKDNLGTSENQSSKDSKSIPWEKKQKDTPDAEQFIEERDRAERQKEDELKRQREIEAHKRLEFNAQKQSRWAQRTIQDYKEEFVGDTKISKDAQNMLRMKEKRLKEKEEEQKRKEEMEKKRAEEQLKHKQAENLKLEQKKKEEEKKEAEKQHLIKKIEEARMRDLQKAEKLSASQLVWNPSGQSSNEKSSSMKYGSHSTGSKRNREDSQGRRSWEDSQGTKRSREDSQGTKRSWEDSQGTRRSWEDGQGSRRSWEDSQGTKRSWEDSQGTRRSWEDSQGTKRSWEDSQGTKRSWEDSQGTRRSWEDSQGTRRSWEDNQGTKRSWEDSQGTSAREVHDGMDERLAQFEHELAKQGKIERRLSPPVKNNPYYHSQPYGDQAQNFQVIEEDEYRCLKTQNLLYTLPRNFKVCLSYVFNRYCPVEDCPAKTCFKSSETFREHWSIFHKPETTMRFCQNCSAYFMDLEELENHIMKHHRLSSFEAEKLARTSRVKVISNPSFRDPSPFIFPS